MFTEDGSSGAKQDDIIFGSGLSGMIAAYIRARAREDNASEDDGWHAQLALLPRARAKSVRAKRAPGGVAAPAEAKGTGG